MWAQPVVNVTCDKEAIERSWRTCQRAYFPDETHRNVMPAEICGSIECFLQCIEDAVGECLQTDPFLDQLMDYDYQKWKIHYRYVCSNVTLGSKVFLNTSECISNDTCRDVMPTNLTEILQDLYANGRYMEYRETLCSAYKKARDCVYVKATQNCSADMAKYFEDVIHIGMSFSICDNTDMGGLYEKFGGEARCGSPKVNSKCLTSRIITEVSRCPSLLIAPNDINLTSSLSQYCRNIDCNIKCLADAVGKCDMEEKNFLFDPEVIKVSGRAACANQQVLVSALDNCKAVHESQCQEQLSSASAEANLYLEQQNYTAYRQTLCRSFIEWINCLNYLVEDSCTTEMIAVLKDIYRVKFSFDKCDWPRGEIFTRYGHELRCDTSGTSLERICLPLIAIMSVIVTVLYL